MPPIHLLVGPLWANRFGQVLQPPILSPEDLFERDSIALAVELQCSLEDIEECKQSVALKLLKLPETGSWKDLPSALPSDVERRNFPPPTKTFGFAALDRCFGDMLPSKQIISIIGDGQSGKTTLAQMAAVNNALKGNRVLFIDTCNQLNPKRLSKLMAYSMSQHPLANTPVLSTQEQRTQYLYSKLTNIHIQKCFDIWSALNLFTKLVDATTNTVLNTQGNDFLFDVIIVDCLHHWLTPYLMENNERIASTTSSTAQGTTALSSLVANIHPYFAQLHLLMRSLCTSSNSTILVTSVLQPMMNAMSNKFRSTSTVSSSSNNNTTTGTGNGQASRTMSTKSVGSSIQGSCRGIPISATGGTAYLTDVYDCILLTKPSPFSNDTAVEFLIDVILRPPYWKMLPTNIQIFLNRL